MAHFDDSATQRANVRYIRQSMKQPLLSRDKELDLARRWRDENDETALDDRRGDLLERLLDIGRGPRLGAFQAHHDLVDVPRAEPRGNAIGDRLVEGHQADGVTL